MRRRKERRRRKTFAGSARVVFCQHFIIDLWHTDLIILKQSTLPCTYRGLTKQGPSMQIIAAYKLAGRSFTLTGTQHIRWFNATRGPGRQKYHNAISYSLHKLQVSFSKNLSSNRQLCFHMPHITVTIFLATACRALLARIPSRIILSLIHI